ncbi:putative protein 33 [Haloarcula hispanica icosahedral virus 2]|uniref:Uncharacterized protein n=1 Tax=Haloarcula hispanica icosahedral virus 2 TaxID=1154689 RepID=H9AZY9_9VIRU|nr:putative protein 33 [Haloarcula hispanica icosahedral virus 2]AFD02314.1 putative protein 33 [Haloarcula hispanica icosahedral virus 2]
MSDDDDDRVQATFMVPRGQVEQVDMLADDAGVSRAEILRRFVEYGLAANADAVGIEAEIAAERRRIIEDGAPIDDAGGFAGRVESNFMERFRNGYRAKWLIAKAENYRREARMLEQKVPQHPDAPDIEEGELVEEVDRVLRDSLEACQLSDWGGEDNPFHEFEGVEEGMSGVKMALTLTRNALRMDEEIEPLASEVGSERRVRPDDLPDAALGDLPEHIDAEDVVGAARALADRGVGYEEVETDPTESDLFTADPDPDPEALPVESEAVETDPALEPETDGGTSELAAASCESASELVSDGGDHAALQSFDTPAESGGETTADDDTIDMDHEPNPTPDRSEIVDELADEYSDLGGGDAARNMVLASLTDPNMADESGRQRAVEKQDLDPVDVVADAVEQAEAAVEEVDA